MSKLGYGFYIYFMKHLKRFENFLALNPAPKKNMYDRISLYKVADRIWAAVIPDDYLRCWTFLRCQEYYESTSPYFQNNRFTWEDYIKWYKSGSGPRGGSEVFTYANDWSGFNLPSEVIEDCISDIKDPGPYDHIMDCMIKTIKQNESGNYYLLGIKTIDNIEDDLLNHELAHGMWYTDPKYKAEMESLLNRMTKSSVKKVKQLIAEIGYAESVLSDEAQAYLSTGIYDEWKVDDIDSWTEPFKEVFDRYKNKHLLNPPKKYEVSYEEEGINESRHPIMDRTYPEEETMEFVHKMNEMISKNWEFYFVDYDELSDYIEKNMGLPYEDHFGEKKASNMLEGLIIKLLNVGYIVGKFNSDILNSSKNKFNYENFFSELENYYSVDRIGNERLVWNGPDIKSSSILAGSFNIKDDIRDIRAKANKYHRGKKDGEILIILGKIFQYGYGIGHDLGYQSFMNKTQELHKKLAMLKDPNLSEEEKKKSI